MNFSNFSKQPKSAQPSFAKSKAARLIAVFALVIVAGTAVFSSTSAAGTLQSFFSGAASSASAAIFGAPSTAKSTAEPKGFEVASPVSEEPGALTARAGHTATQLDNGKVLLAGGDATGTAQIFDPAASSSTAFANTGNLLAARANHTATKLANGKVLIAGGSNGGDAALNSTEIYDPTAGTFAEGATMGTARAGHTATVLSNGKILIAGGDAAGSAEIYDPETNSFSYVSTNMNVARSNHSAVLMNDGRVLLVGGVAGEEELNSAEIFNPTESTFTSTGSAMAHHRAKAVLRVLHDGKVQIIGGNDDESMEVYDPAIDTIGAHAHVIPLEDEHAALLKTDILNAPTRAALIRPDSSDARLDRSNHTITEISSNSKALVAGGANNSGVLNTFSVYNSSNATVSTDKLDYAPGQTARISGTGWQAGETVNIIVHEDPHTHTERRLTATADEYGNFSANYLVDDHDLRITFIIGAKGQLSNRTAQTTFTDASPGSLGNYATLGLSGTTAPTDITPSNVAANASFSNLTRGTGLTPQTAADAFVASSWQQTATLTILNNTDYYEFTITPNSCYQFSASELRVGLQRSNQGPQQAELRSSLDSYGSTIGSLINVGTSLSLTTINLSTISGLQNRNTAVTFRIYGYNATNNGGTLRIQRITSPAMVGLEVDGTVTAIAGNVAPSVTTHPTNQTITSGQNAVFTAAASGSPAPSVQWQENTGSGFTNIPGATSTTLTVTNPSVSQSGTQYRAVFSNCNGSVNSNAATLTVNNATAATSLAVSVATGTYGGTANLTATLTQTSGGAGVNGKTINFTLNGTAVGSATTNASGVATLNNASLSGINASTYPTGVAASFAGDSGFLTSNGSNSLTVNQKSLTPNITAQNKEYDGTTAATIAGRTLTGVVGTDDVTLTGGTATFDNKNVGTNKTVTATGLTLSGTKAGNYSLSSTSATTTANIIAKSLTVTAAGINKVYDGTTTATVNLSGNSASGDSVTLGYSANFDTKNAGTNKTVNVTAIAISGGADAGNYTLGNTTATTTANITPKTLTVTATGVDKIYDGTTAATANLASDAISGDTVTLSYSASFADKNVGNGKTVNVSGIAISGGADAGNYTLGNTTATATANITAKTLTVTATAQNKVYDGNANASVTLSIQAGGVIGNDAVSTSFTGASFSDKNVGVGKTVNVNGIALTGADAGNYTANNTANTTADITAKNLTISGAVANSKTYDGLTAASVNFSSATLTGAVVSDVVTINSSSYTANFGDKNVGSGKPVSVSGVTLGGADALNYTLSQPSSLTADITAKNLTINGAVANNKVYDGSPTATVNFTNAELVGVVSPDVVSINNSGYTAGFDNKNVGTGKPVTISGVALNGADAGNYTVSQLSGLTADITAKNLTINGAVANSKTYDGSAAATVNFGSATLDGVIAPDVATISSSGYAANFDNKNVGTGKAVTVSGVSLGGADAGNYTVSQVSGLTADITAATVTGSFAANNKPYDGTTAATIASRSITGGKVGSEDVTLTGGTATFDNKNVGNGKTVSGTGFTLGGTDSGNYILGSVVAAATADITAKTLTITATGVNKVYDGTSNATVTLADDRISGDVFTASYNSATFADKNVGNGKPISVGGISISGTDAGNYSANATANAAADITAKTLTVTATGVNKVYDGTTTATVNLSGDGISADVVTLSYSANFADKNVGNGKTVNVTNIAISGGADSGNYTLGNTTASAAADITPKTLTVTATAQDKEYDGNANASVTLSIQAGGVIGSDAVGTSFTGAAFDNKNVGNGKTVTVSGISLTGANAGNYTANNTANASANITAKALTPNITVANKTYDRTTAATITNRSLSGAVGTDDVSLTGGTATFGDANAGNGKTVSGTGFTLSGTDAGNYTLGSDATTTANITPKSVTATVTAGNKEYDGNANAAITGCSLSGVINPDSTGCAASPTASDNQFDNKNVANGKTVTANNLALTDNASSNYVLSSAAAQTTANITAKALTASITAVSKEYDGNTGASITACSFTGVISGDTVNCLITGYSASFDNKNVGTNKSVTVSGLGKDGSESGNYTFDGTGAGAADITAKALTASVAANNKPYDGNVTATISGCSFAGVVNSDVVNCETTGYTASFDNKNAGTNKPVTASGLGKSGADAANYSFNGNGSGSANITPVVLTATVAALNKPYDGNAAAAITGCLFNGVVTNDTVNCETTGYLASFNNKNVGTGKPVTASGLGKSGADAGNYNFDGSGTGTADITAVSLTATVSASNKPYDGNANATIASCAFSGAISGDTVNCEITGYSASFNNQNVGNGKLVTVSGLSKSGTDAGNYNFDGNGTGSADITPKTVTVSSVTASSKIYDGNSNAAITNCVLAGIVLPDTTGCAASATAADNQFDNKNVGNGKTVTANNISLTNNAAGNYALGSTTATTTANITALHITGGFTADNKMYDGNATATVLARSLNGAIGGDAVSLDGGTAAFDNKNVGNGKTVTLSGAGLTGNDAGNYVLDSVSTTSANITAKSLTATVAANSKPYDANITATINGCTFSGVVSGDTVNCIITGYSASFDNKNVGTGKPVSVTALSKSGVDAGNYTFDGTGTGSADITAISLTASVIANSKTYDGNTNATINSCSFSGVVSSDTVNCETTGYTASFDNKNVGTNKPVTASGLGKSGADAANYSFNGSGTGSANVTVRTLNVSATAQNKVFDGNTNASVTLSDNRVSGDAFTVGYTSALFDNPNIGANKTVTVSGISIGGADAGNYVLASTTAATTANITAAGTTTTVLVNSSPVQYSDPVTFTANIAATNTGLNNQLTGYVQFYINGAAFGNTVPAAFGASGGTASLPFNNQLVPGAYQVSADFVSTNTNFSGNGSGVPANPNLNVAKEDARVYFTGMTFVNTANATSSSATVLLSATVKDITAETSDSAHDVFAGNISKATVTFINRDNGTPISGCSGLTVQLVNAADTKVGTVACNWAVNLNSSDSEEFTVGIVVNNHYTRDASTDNEVITVSKPLGTNFITGGGHMVNAVCSASGVNCSAGQYAGAAGLKTNFGFNVKYNNSGRNLQGRVNVIIRAANGKVYQIKGNQMDTLTVNNTNQSARTAVYTGKANVTDITNPLVPVSLGGGHTFQMKMTDKGEPGSADLIGITLYANNGGAVLFSSNWNGTTTVEQLIKGGNLVVR